MDPPDQVGSQGAVHRPVPRDPRLSLKPFCGNGNPEVALPAFLVSSMAPVRLALVHDIKPDGRERAFKFLPDLVFNTHFYLFPSSIPRLGG